MSFLELTKRSRNSIKVWGLRSWVAEMPGSGHRFYIYDGITGACQKARNWAHAVRYEGRIFIRTERPGDRQAIRISSRTTVTERSPE